MMGDPLDSKPEDFRPSDAPVSENPNSTPVKTENNGCLVGLIFIVGVYAGFAAVFSLYQHNIVQFLLMSVIATLSIVWSVYKKGFFIENTTEVTRNDSLSETANYPQRPSTSTTLLSSPRVDKPMSSLEVGGQVISQHTREAIRAASRIVDLSQPLVTDVGLLVYRGAEKPMIYRTLDVPDDTETIQPFVQLHVPLPLLESGVGRVCFEILENSKDVVFSYEQVYTLRDGLNLLTPPARLPVRNSDKSYVWEMRVSLGDTLLAVHDFGWTDANAQEDMMALGTDGEISEEMRTILEEQDGVGQPLSLDDLLAESADEAQERGV
jgi:hypothetical protein